MPRYALKIEYVGTRFSGWQRQDDQPTVQGAVENALRTLEADAPGIAAAGRTDAGVHATGQVAHCDLAKDWDAFRLAEAMNYHLKPEPIAITDVACVATDWHARFSAVERRYTYRVVARRAPLTRDKGLAWRVPARLDVEAMKNAASTLVGHHDFTTFRSTMCQAASPEKTLDALEIVESAYPGGAEYHFHLRARSFLHNQVRSFVGTLERVGAGRWPADRVRAALEARDRAACGPVAPPDGLTLTSVGYVPDPFSWA
ncbi:MAG: tRNA pseudouridine(38-40) synthase TruA [Pseudomonadota bacterium]